MIRDTPKGTLLVCSTTRLFHIYIRRTNVPFSFWWSIFLEQKFPPFPVWITTRTLQNSAHCVSKDFKEWTVIPTSHRESDWLIDGATESESSSLFSEWVEFGFKLMLGLVFFYRLHFGFWLRLILMDYPLSISDSTMDARNGWMNLCGFGVCPLFVRGEEAYIFIQFSREK